MKQAEPERFDALFNAFAVGYAGEFKGDEAESTAEWLARIDGKRQPQPLMRIVVAVDRADGQDRVVGGVASEYYRASGCVLATYLYVLKQYQKQGHARALLEEARAACALSGPVRQLIAEAEWPERMLPSSFAASEIAEARKRLRFFPRIGARMFNLDYVQPALAGGGKQPVSHLRLLVVPQQGGADPADDELRVHIEAFLGEFYEALSEDSQVPLDQATLDGLCRQVRERRPLTLPLPILRVDDVALCYHFVEQLDASGETTELLNEVKRSVCPVFHSMETDLLSRAYRTRRPFRTVCLTKPPDSSRANVDAGLALEIVFPQRVAFCSENRREERHWPLRKRAARAYLACSFFFDARIIVWHLTIKAAAAAPSTTDEHAWFDELDLITLLKLADDGADQEFLRVPLTGEKEEQPIARGVEFRLIGDAARDLDDLLVAVAAEAKRRHGDNPIPTKARSSTAATLQLLDWDTDAKQPFHGITDLHKREALCGIITGILDFDEIDDAEVRDTLTPSVTLEDALLRAHRAVLVYVAQDDRAARTVGGTVGISPYLIIPHATALCNEWLLDDLLSRPSAAHESRGHSKDLILFEDTLRLKWVPNVFFYPTEQKLYERALIEGGIRARRDKTEELLLDLKTRVQLARETLREKFEAIVAGLVGAIGVLQIDPVIVEVLAPWLALVGQWGKLLGHGIALALACFIGYAIFLWKRPRPDKED